MSGINTEFFFKLLLLFLTSRAPKKDFYELTIYDRRERHHVYSKIINGRQKCRSLLFIIIIIIVIYTGPK